MLVSNWLDVSAEINNLYGLCNLPELQPDGSIVHHATEEEQEWREKAIEHLRKAYAYAVKLEEHVL